MGQFTVDEIEQSISKQAGLVNTIRCRAADIRQSFKEQRTKDYHDMTLGSIIAEVAGRQGLGAQVSGSAASIKYKYLAQTDESDLHFMTRLARKHDCIGSPKNGKLIFVKKGESPVGSLFVVPQMVIEATATEKSRPQHSGARGSWWDRLNVERMFEMGSGGTGSAISGLVPMWADGKKDAKEAASSRASELKRAEKSLNMTIVGNPAAMAEALVTVAGVGSLIDGQYRIKKATHRITKAEGYQTTIEGELPG